MSFVNKAPGLVQLKVSKLVLNRSCSIDAFSEGNGSGLFVIVGLFALYRTNNEIKIA